MTSRHRRELIACLAGAVLALGGAIALTSFRVFAVLHRTFEIFYGDRGDPMPPPDLAAAALAIAAGLLLVGAAGLAIAGRRAALALQRASLIETT